MHALLARRQDVWISSRGVGAGKKAFRGHTTTPHHTPPRQLVSLALFFLSLTDCQTRLCLFSICYLDLYHKCRSPKDMVQAYPIIQHAASSHQDESRPHACCTV